MQLTSDLQTATTQAQVWWAGHAASASAPLQAAMAKTQAFMNPLQRAAQQVEALWAQRAELPESGLETMVVLAHMCYQNMWADLFADRRGARIALAGLRELGEGGPTPQPVEDDPAPLPEYTNLGPEPTPGPDQ